MKNKPNNTIIILKQKVSFQSTFVLLVIPLALSAFTHIWNPIGFPSIHIDESHYLRRAMLVLEGQGPQESSADGFPYPYDHPYFGQIFLAGLLKIASYTDFVKTSPLPSVDNIRHSI